MAYVQPNSVIQLFRGINLDNRYMHTIYFANESAQNSWFTGKVYKTYQGQSYTRYTRNQIKIKDDATSLLDCTYMRFMNDRTVDKWFYAFITAIEYINENTALVSYEIDVMQTWFIQNGTLLPCYIERQHVNDDTFGTNLEAEPIGSDVYDFTEITVNGIAGDFGRYDIVLCTTAEPQENEMIRDGIVCGATYDYFPLPEPPTGGFGQLKNRILQALGSWDKQQQKADIVDLFMFPLKFCSQNNETYHVIHDGKFDNYTPKNNKLHSYPYSSLYITTNDGDTGMYKWEYFEGDIIHSSTGAQFNLNATLTGGGYIEMHPRAYNGILENFDAKIVMQNFPKCSWGYDAYQAWIANGGQYKANYEMNMVQRKGALAIAQGGLSGVSSIVGNAGSTISSQQAKHPNPMTPINNTIGSAFTGVNTVLNEEQTYLSFTEARDKIAFEFKDARYEPNILLGAQVPNIAVGKEYLCYKFYKMHIRDDEAKRIDDFFSVYGYAINKVETPNLTGRQYWNFIKTHNAEISGNMPSSSKSAIGKIFDGGIFFWRNGDQVGNFRQSVTDGSVNNPIV